MLLRPRGVLPGNTVAGFLKFRRLSSHSSSIWSMRRL
jgi:hypothetical protein